MNRRFASKSRTALVALALVSGTATTASAVDKHYVSVANNGAWSTVSSWSPAGQPGPLDNVYIGNVAGVQNNTVLLDLNESVESVHITDGMTLDTNGSTLNAGVNIDVSGRNTVGTNVFPSRLRVDQIVPGAEVSTQALTVVNQAEVVLVGGGLAIDAFMTIGADGFLRGAGTVTLNSNFNATLTNDGTIAPSGAMTFYQTGTGEYDLDGTSGGGQLDLTAASNSSLTFNDNGLVEPFGGTLAMIKSTLLDMNLDQSWIVEPSGVFNIYGSGTGTGPARIAGMPLTFHGTMNLYGGSEFQVQADVTFGTNSELVTGTNAAADIAGAAIVNGGLFTINQNSTLEFNGATTVHGGSFNTHSDVSTDGSIDFNGATEWDGDVSFTGFARQNGPAHVTGNTIITADTFDMDGSNAATWDLDAYLTMNVDRIDFSSNTFNTTMNIGAGRLTVNLPGAEYWGIAGTMNLSGNSILFSTKIGDGSPLIFTGEVNVVGKCDIATSTLLASSATINIPAANAALRFMGSATIGVGVTFSGAGTIQNGNNGLLLFHPGVNTNGVGLHNAGELRLGIGAGTISVDRFVTTGTWNIDLGGHNAITQYDRLVCNGPATLGGVLDVNLTSGFQPNVGDEFTILNATGGITGAFAPNVTSVSGTTTYYWDVIVSAADVVLRLAAITPCYANCDGSSAAPALNVADFVCFQNKYAAGSDYANCDNSTIPPVLNVADFICFMNKYSAGCP